MRPAQPMPIFGPVITCKFCDHKRNRDKDFYSDIMRRQRKCIPCCRLYAVQIYHYGKSILKSGRGIAQSLDFSPVQKLEDVAIENAKQKRHQLFDVSRMITETIEILNTKYK